MFYAWNSMHGKPHDRMACYESSCISRKAQRGAGTPLHPGPAAERDGNGEMNMSRAVVLDGERPGEVLLGSLREAVTAELSARGWEVRLFPLREMAVAPCNGCFGCWIKTPGECVQEDDAPAMAREVIGAHLLVVLTSVTFGCYSSTSKRAIERLLPLLSPFFEKVDGEIHHRRRYPRFPDYLVLGVQPKPDPEAAALFSTLAGRNAVNIRASVHRCGIFPTDRSVESMRPEISSLLRAFGDAQ
jgi:hypothetical protein